VSYDLSGESGASPVTITGMRVEMQLPLHGEPQIAFEGNRVTATGKGEVVASLGVRISV